MRRVETGIDLLDPMYEDAHASSKEFGIRKRLENITHRWSGPDARRLQMRKNYRKKLGLDCPLQFTREVMKNVSEYRWPRFYRRVFRRQTKLVLVRTSPSILPLPASALSLTSLTIDDCDGKRPSHWDRYEFSLNLKATDVDILRKIAQSSSS